MSQRERESEDVQRLLAEGEMEVAERAAERRLQLCQRREFADLFDTAAAKTPAELHATLLNLVAVEVANPESALHQKNSEGFFSRLRDDGLVHATMWALTRDDPSAGPDSVNRLLAGPVFRSVLASWGGLASLSDHSWPRCAWQWLKYALELAPKYIPDPSELVGLLAPYLDADSPPSRRLAELCPEAAVLAELPWKAVSENPEAQSRWFAAQFVRSIPSHAAVILSPLVPDTPGLLGALTDAIGRDWQVWHFGRDEEYYLWDAATSALAVCGPLGRAALPRLRAAVTSSATGDRKAAFDAFAALCGDDAEIAALLDEVATAGRETNDVLDSVVSLARDRPALAPSLFQVLEGCSWGDGYRHYAEAGFRALDFLCEAGYTADAVFPFAAALHSGHKSEWDYLNKPTKVARDILDRITSNGPRTDEEAFLAALRGLSPHEFPWLGYADWLDDRDDPRGELVRLRHLRAGPDATDDSRERLAAWVAAHGDGWDALYDAVVRPL